MDKEEFQKKYDNSILVCCTEDKIKKVFNICDLMNLTASNSKQSTAILIAKSPLFHVEQFFSDFYKLTEKKKLKDNGNQSKEPFFKKGNRVMYTIEDQDGNTYAVDRLSERMYESKEHKTLFITDEKGNRIMYAIKDGNGNTYPVSRLSERVYESKEHGILFITDEEGVVTGIYKEK